MKELTFFSINLSINNLGGIESNAEFKLCKQSLAKAAGVLMFAYRMHHADDSVTFM